MKKSTDVTAHLISLSKKKLDGTETERELDAIMEHVNPLNAILDKTKKPSLEFSSVNEDELRRLNVTRGQLKISTVVLGGLTRDMTKTTTDFVNSLRVNLLEIYEHVNMDSERGHRMVLDAILLTLAKFLLEATFATQRLAILPNLKLGSTEGVPVLNPLTGYEVHLTGSVDYCVIVYDDIGDNKERLLGRGGSRVDALDIAKGRVFLITNKREHGPSLTSYLPEAVSQAIVLHKSTKGLDEARFCLSDGLSWIFFVLKEIDGTYEYYESYPLQLSYEALKKSILPLCDIVQLLFEWLNAKPTDQLYQQVTSRSSTQYNIGDVVLGKVRGYPPWPGVVVDPAEVPSNVLSEQPPGKNVPFYCVLFMPMGDYAWLRSKDMSALSKHEMEAFLADENKKRNRELYEGYRHALDPKPFIEKLKEDRAALAQELQEREQNAGVDQLESEPDDGQDDDSRADKKPKAAPSKKRKRDSEVESKPKKAPKAKKDAADPSKKKAAAAKGRKNGVKSKAMVESEDEGDAEEDADEDGGAGPSKKTSSPPAKKSKREKEEGDDLKHSTDPQADQVRDWRYRLQKVFLSNKGLPKSELMPEIDGLFTTIEQYESMTIEQLQHSKIGKVMHHITVLDDGKIPGDDEFKFRIRAKNLVDKWLQILNANKPTTGSPAASTGHTNGKSDKENEITKGEDRLALDSKSFIEKLREDGAALTQELEEREQIAEVDQLELTSRGSTQYNIGDVVLGKVRGYPPWPCVVVDPADVPFNVLSEQPPGKKVTFYCVLFIPMGDYAWLHSKDMSALSKHEMEAFLADDNKKRNRELCEGYRLALDPKPFIEKLKEDRIALARELEKREQNAKVDQLELTGRSPTQYNIGDVVLGKVRGYPPWPCVVVDPAKVPFNVLSEQPPGKKVTFYCVLFIPMGDYAWLHSKDMSALSKHEMEAFLADDNKKRNRELCEGYRVALDPQPFIEKLEEDRRALARELEKREKNAKVDQLELTGRSPTQYNIGDVVLGKVRGYPPWPAVVVDPAEVPSNVLREQPPGKKVTFYCVLFMPMGDYAWFHSKDMSALSKHEMEAFLADENKKRNRELCEGYRLALDPKPFIEKLKAALAQELEEREQNSEVDQLESDPDDGQDDDSRAGKESNAAPSKKRKRDSEVESKPKKAPMANKNSADSSKRTATAKGRTNDVESEDDGGSTRPARKHQHAQKNPKTTRKTATVSRSSSPDLQADHVPDWRGRLQKALKTRVRLQKKKDP